VRWRRGGVALAHPDPEGRAVLVAGDPETTAASLEPFGDGDGDAYLRMHAYWERIGGALLESILSPFPPLRGGARLAAALGGPRQALELARLGVLGVRRFGEEEFAGEGARRLYAGNALHADFAPESAGSALYGLLLCGLAQQVGFPVAEGGAGRLTDALVRRLGTRARIECGARAERIVVRGGRAVAVRTADGREHAAARAVLAAVDAPQLYRDLVDPAALPARVHRDIRRFQWDGARFKVDYALSGPVPWPARGMEQAGTIHIADSVDALTEAASQLARSLVPARPFLIAGQYAALDPTRAPAGADTFWAYAHVPRTVRGDAGGDGLTGRWDEREAERFADRVTAEIERVAPGFRDRVRARAIATPLDLQAQDRSLDRGAINGGTAQLHQQLVLRPIPGLGRAETAVRGLYLASSSAHPGGGVHGACGANAARAALAPVRRLMRRRRSG
jgi:phytoene dehydrogenase-like protein